MNGQLMKTFETHLTLDASRAEHIELAQRWATESGLKWSEIVLSQGDHPLQPMITFWGAEPLESQHAQAQQIRQELSALGIQVVRTKIETDASDSLFTEPNQYFECHVKLHVRSAEELDTVQRVAKAESAHVSRNARRIRSDGTEERFLTLRSYDCTGSVANSKKQRLLSAVRAAGLTVVEVEFEFVVFDSNLSLDDGWGVP